MSKLHLPSRDVARSALSVIVELAGLAVLVLAAWLFLPILGVVALGLALIYSAQGI